MICISFLRLGVGLSMTVECGPSIQEQSQSEPNVSFDHLMHRFSYGFRAEFVTRVPDDLFLRCRAVVHRRFAVIPAKFAGCFSTIPKGSHVVPLGVRIRRGRVGVYAGLVCARRCFHDDKASRTSKQTRNKRYIIHKLCKYITKRPMTLFSSLCSDLKK